MTVADVRRQTAERMASTPADEQLACRYCGDMTPRATLSALAARCQACFDQYQRLGYSGVHPPRQHKQASWVKAEAERARQGRSARGHDGNAFVALSQQLQAKQAEREGVKGLDDDEVNALLGEVQR